MSILATRTPILELPRHRAICKRCGNEREVNTSVRINPLCSDCKWSMTREERALWGAV
jgi:hypothetical protein